MAGKRADEGYRPREVARTGATYEPPFLLSLFGGTPAQKKRGGRKTVGADDVIRGGLPRIALGMEKDPSLWFEGFETTYLERDVSNFARVALLTCSSGVVTLTITPIRGYYPFFAMSRPALCPGTLQARRSSSPREPCVSYRG